MRARALTVTIFLLAWLRGAVALAAEDVPEPMHADLVRGLDPRPSELEANVLAITPLGADRGGVAWAPEIEWAPTRRAAFELELPFIGRELQTVKLATQLTWMRPRGRRPAQGLLVSASLPLHHAAGLQVTHVLEARLGRRFGLVTQIGPHVTLHATSKRSSVGIVVGTSGFVSLRDGSAIGIESSWTHEARNDRFEVLPQIHVHPTRHLRLQMGLGGRLDLGTKRLTAIVGLRFIVER